MKKIPYYLIIVGLSAVTALGPQIYTYAGGLSRPDANTYAGELSRPDANAYAGKPTHPGVSVPDVSDILENPQELFQYADGASVRRRIRETLTVMDEMGISPSAVAENLFGIQTDPARNVETFGSELVKEAQKEVTQRSEGFMSTLWEGFLDTLGNLFSTIFSLFDLGSILHR